MTSNRSEWEPKMCSVEHRSRFTGVLYDRSGILYVHGPLKKGLCTMYNTIKHLTHILLQKQFLSTFSPLFMSSISREKRWMISPWSRLSFAPLGEFVSHKMLWIPSSGHSYVASQLKNIRSDPVTMLNQVRPSIFLHTEMSTRGDAASCSISLWSFCVFPHHGPLLQNKRPLTEWSSVPLCIYYFD